MSKKQTETSCRRCGRRYFASARDVEGWNAEFHHGIVRGLICPGCHTPEENAEAVMKDAVGDSAGARAVYPSDPGYAEAASQAMVSVIEHVWSDWIDQVISGDTPQPFDPYALADTALARATVVGLGRPAAGSEDHWREMVAQHIVDLAENGPGR